MSVIHAERVATNVGTRDVAVLLARRGLRAIRRMPAAFIPSLIMPIFLTIAFSGAYSAITRIPTFPTTNALSWFVPQAALQGASFGGMGVAFGALRDLETGFFDRLLMSPAPRRALLIGPMLSGTVRAVVPVVLVLIVGGLGGIAMPGGLMAIVALLGAAIGISLIAGLFGLGLAYRLKTMAATALVQFAIFFALFLSEAQMPARLVRGWLKPIAEHNPATHIQRLARAGFLGDVTWAVTWPALLSIAGVLAVAIPFAVRGLKRITP
jgi:ABC-2 type transport system permease protein